MLRKLKRLVAPSLGVMGYKFLVSPFSHIRGFPQDMEDGFEQVYQTCHRYTMTSPERMYALYKAVEYIIHSKIPGDFVECGVWKGGSSMIIAHTLLQMGEKDRKIYLYDTFTGMTEPTQKDLRSSDSLPAFTIWEKMQKKDYNDWAFAPLNEVRENMLSTGYPSQNITFIPGKVEDTVPTTIPTRIALLRLDTDWYESTYHELTHLFPLLSNRGVLLIDDYGHFKGAREAVDQYFQEQNTSILLSRIDYTGRLGIKYD